MRLAGNRFSCAPAVHNEHARPEGRRVILGAILLLALAGCAAVPAATWTRHGIVVHRGPAGAWDADEVAGEQVFRDGARWVMVYSGWDLANVGRIGLAYSDDLLHWTKEPRNPVYVASAGDVMSATANVIRVGSQYRLYAQVYPASDAFALATSSDLVTWTDRGHVFWPAAGQWDGQVIFDPDPHVRDGITYLYYGGQALDGTRGIGLATSVDGVHFTRQGRVLTPAQGEASVSYGAPAMLDGIYHDAARVETPTTRYIDLGGQPVFTAGSGWDGVQVFDAAPVMADGTLYLFYAGSATPGSALGLSSQIGLATSR